ncbi:unnamed protein product, partial [Polarella glacialis]
ALVTGTVLNPSFDVLDLTELEGTSYILSADGRGFMSCWDISPRSGKNEPVHYFSAHDEKLTQVITLGGTRLPELIETTEWESDPSSVVRQNTKPRGFGLLQSLCCCCSGKSGRTARRKKDAKHWLVATASEDGAIRVWRWRLVNPRQRLRTKKGEVAPEETSPVEVDFITEWISAGKVPISRCVELHDGLLAVALKDSVDVRLIDPCTATVACVLYGHTRPLSALAQCGDGRLVSGGADGAVRLWVKQNWGGTDRQLFQEALVKPEKDGLEAAADADWDPEPTPPAAPYGVWGETEEEKEVVAGVCSMAFFAHMQQAQKGECVAMAIRVLVQSAENLPKAQGIQGLGGGVAG